MKICLPIRILLFIEITFFHKINITTSVTTSSLKNETHTDTDQRTHTLNIHRKNIILGGQNTSVLIFRWKLSKTRFSHFLLFFFFSSLVYERLCPSQCPLLYLALKLSFAFFTVCNTLWYSWYLSIRRGSFTYTCECCCFFFFCLVSFSLYLCMRYFIGESNEKKQKRRKKTATTK